MIWRHFWSKMMTNHKPNILKKSFESYNRDVHIKEINLGRTYGAHIFVLYL